MAYNYPAGVLESFTTIREETAKGANTKARVADAMRDAYQSSIPIVLGVSEAFAIALTNLGDDHYALYLNEWIPGSGYGGGIFDRVEKGTLANDGHSTIVGSNYAWVRRPESSRESASASSTLLVNGANNSVTVPVTSIVQVTGPTGTVTINGLKKGPHGTCRMFELAYNYDTVVEYNSSSAAAGEKILTPSGADLTLYAPGANGYNTVTMRYDATALSGAGAWRVIGYIGGA